MTAVLPSSFLVTVFSVIAERTLSSSDASRSITLECEHRLAEVVGQVVRAAQQDCEAIARSILREIFRLPNSLSARSLGLPYFQPESYARGVVSHASISCQPLMG